MAEGNETMNVGRNRNQGAEHSDELATPITRDGEMAAMRDLARRFVEYRDAAGLLVEVSPPSKRDDLITQRYLWAAAAELTEQTIRDNA